jgi:cyclopropane-fatty-acyl-phospholipid synthase
MSGKRGVEFTPDKQFYQSYSTEEDKSRTNTHYEQPVAFFNAVTGGRWNVYSCNLWDDTDDQTASQEAKLDLMASLMNLQPGQRILDVGCGWGGPLTYLCKKYSVEGVGLTLSPSQRVFAQERADREGIRAEVIECHWRDYTDDRGFDIVYTDEVIVHFNDLGGFFQKAFDILKDGGRMVNKELHYTHSRYSEMTRGLSHINEIYGSTGNYRTLADELGLSNAAGFEVQTIHQIPLAQYRRTMSQWMSNMKSNRAELEALVGPEYFKRFLMYLKICHRIFYTQTMTMDIIISHKAATSA